MPLYFDELSSLNYFVKRELITPFNEFAQANNHTLNTALTTLTYRLFGAHPMALRLPNLLAFTLYALYLFKLGTFLPAKWIRTSLYVLMLTIPGIIDFFALSRGYGLSFAFLLVSIYYTMKSYEKMSIFVLFASEFSIILALFANLSLLIVSLCILVILSMNTLRHFQQFRENRQLLLVAGIKLASSSMLGLALSVIFFYKSRNLMWWGKDGTFWDATMRSQATALFNSDDPYFIYRGVIILIFIALVILCIRQFRNFVAFKKESLIPLLFFVNLLAIWVLAITFDVEYPYQRTGFHLTILFILAVLFSAQWLQPTPRKQSLMYVLPLVALPISAILNFSWTNIRFWESDSIPQKFVSSVLSSVSEEEIPTIRIEGMGFLSWNYQIAGMKYYGPVARVDANRIPVYEFVIAQPKNMLALAKYYKRLDQSDRLGPCLYTLKHPLEKRRLAEFKSDRPVVSSDQYLDLCKLAMSGLNSTTLLFEIDLETSFLKFPSKQFLYVAVKSQNETRSYGHVAIALDEVFFEGGRQTARLQYADFIENLPVNVPLVITAFIHNTGLREIRIQKSSLRISTIETGH